MPWLRATLRQHLMRWVIKLLITQGHYKIKAQNALELVLDVDSQVFGADLGGAVAALDGEALVAGDAVDILGEALAAGDAVAILGAAGEDVVAGEDVEDVAAGDTVAAIATAD